MCVWFNEIMISNTVSLPSIGCEQSTVKTLALIGASSNKMAAIVKMTRHFEKQLLYFIC